MYKTAYFILLLKCFGAYQPVFLLTPKSNLNTVTENLRKRDPSLSVAEARKQAKALLGLED